MAPARIVPVLILALALLVATQQTSAQSPDAIEAPVCEVAANPEAYAGQDLVLHGQLLSDFHHASLIAGGACAEYGVFLGGVDGEVAGRREFDEAWYVTRYCPQDGLYFTVRGRIERQHYWDMERWVIAVAEFTNIRRVEGSTCPLTIQEFSDQRERG